MLLKALIAYLRDCSVQPVIGCITLPNQATVALHEKMVMKQVAHFKKVDFKFNEWQDVDYWQLNLHT